ncbi:MAG: Trans-aconitate 2-methyltransferase [Chlamydiia bacterium]|nr:Trans-aconitate 2-methyltransferase [Chlamydiia bacterium]
MKYAALLFSGILLTSAFSSEAYTFNGTEKVLDIACGCGKSSLEIARIVEKGSVVGIDFTMQVINEAKRKHLQGPSNLSFKLKEMDDWNYSSEFDVVRCDSPHQFIFNQPKLLKSMHSLLKKDGHIIVKIPVRLPVALESALRAVTTSDKWNDHFLTFHPIFNIYKKSEYSQLLSKNHFSIVDMKSAPSEEVFATEENFKEFIKGWLPYFEAIPEELRNDFLNDLTKRYLTILPLDKEGKVHFFLEKLEVVAKKLDAKEKVHG